MSRPRVSSRCVYRVRPAMSWTSSSDWPRSTTSSSSTREVLACISHSMRWPLTQTRRSGPAGAIQAAVAGGVGGVIAIVAWILGIPLVSGALVLAGGFMFVMAVYTFVRHTIDR